MQGSPLANDFQSINLINSSLKRLRSDLQITLPKIAVVGVFCIGKSSLIEQLTGLPFLPRYRGHSRFPLEFHFIYAPELEQARAQWNQEVIQFDLIKDRFARQTSMHEISRTYTDKPVVLRIYSKFCPTITVIDTPGLTRILTFPSDSSQIEIVQQVIRRYANQPSNIILTVLPPSLPYSGRQILQFSSRADPYQDRTLACVTKIDIMDRGTDAVSMLLNAQLPMRYGFVGVKTRCSYDRYNDVSFVIEELLGQERKYFKDRDIYNKLPEEVIGTLSLSRKLRMLMYWRIKPQFQSILDYIKSKKRGIECMDILIKRLTSITQSIGHPRNNDVDAQAIRQRLSLLFLQEYVTPVTEGISNQEIQRYISMPTSMPPIFYLDNQTTISYIIGILLRMPFKKLRSQMKQSYEPLRQIIIRACHEEVGGQNSSASKILMQKLSNFMDENFKKFILFSEIILDSEYYRYTNNSNYNQDNTINRQTGKKSNYLDELRQKVDTYVQIMIGNLRQIIPRQMIHFLLVKTIQQLKIDRSKQPQAEITNLQRIILNDAAIMTNFAQKDSQQPQILLPQPEAESFEEVRQKQKPIQTRIQKRPQDAIEYSIFFANIPKPKTQQAPKVIVEGGEKIPIDFSSLFGINTTIPKPQTQQKPRGDIEDRNESVQLQKKRKTFNKLFGI